MLLKKYTMKQGEKEQKNNRKLIVKILTIGLFAIVIGIYLINGKSINFNLKNINKETSENSDVPMEEEIVEDGLGQQELVKNQSIKFIMHAGGRVQGIDYTNVQDALEENYEKGKKYFEVDFSKTKDGKYVCLHSWDGFAFRILEIEKEKALSPMTHKEFMTTNSKNDFIQMDVDVLLKWLKNHQDAYIITDTKEDNLEFLQVLAEKSGRLKKQMIPQIYHFEEYEPTKQLGFDKIILTTYRLGVDFAENKDFFSKNKLFAITIGDVLATEDFLKNLKNMGLKVAVFTVNNPERVKALENMGVNYFYTDVL